ncbi:transcription initiation factor IID, 18kD subunit-domain-containing protein [Phellopilus nigrolimitatus]|nr:transcription initiation factor IID, 18kD subunit-domain-containing protein [Phellopilus nigrolimitatus]
MTWQPNLYQHYPHPSSYPQLAYPQTQEPYAAQGYAWYGYSYPQQQQHAQQPRHVQPPVQHVAKVPTTPAPAPVSAAPTTTTFSSYNPTSTRDITSNAAGTSTGTRGPRRQSQMKGLFSKELPKLMYGFGDDKQVANDSVAVMEEILIEYLVDVCQTALASTRKTRLQIEDLRRTLSRPADAKKLARMEELLFMQEDIKRARKQFEENEMGGGGDY